MATFSADARVTSGLVTRTHDQRNRAAPPCPCCAAANRPDCAAANRPDDCAVAANFPDTAPAHHQSDLCDSGGHGALCPWRKPGVPLPRSGKL